MQESTITPEQQKEIDNVYSYQESAELTPKEIEMVVEMFDVPEKFLVLRKMMQVFTSEERGLVIPNSYVAIDALPEDLEKYGLKVAIESRADEKVRQALSSFYRKVQLLKMREKREELEEKNLIDHEEAKAREKMDEEDTEAQQNFGENL